jgi:hypothetical protein
MGNAISNLIAASDAAETVKASIAAIKAGKRSIALRVCGVRLVDRVSESGGTKFYHLTKECRAILETAGATGWGSQ